MNGFLQCSTPILTESPSSQDDVFIFKEKFHGYIFVDAKGNEYPAIVEFAPYQRMGRVRSKKVDRKCNTFGTSEHFMEFVRTMDTEEVLPKLELKSDFDAKHDNQIRLTPLLEFLNDKKSRKRDRDRKQQQEKKKILAPIKEDGPTKNSRPPKERQGKQQARQPAKEESGPAKRERPERSEKEKARRAERDKMRREKRQQENLEKKKERESVKQQKSTNETGEAGTSDRQAGKSVQATPTNTGTGDDPKKPSRGESRKFSERRQENRSRQSSKRAEDAPASAAGKQAQTAAKAGTADTGKPDKPAAGEEKKKESRRYSERRVRNKDRPAIKIYQPGSRTKPAEE